jgi:hypothetical protein
MKFALALTALGTALAWPAAPAFATALTTESVVHSVTIVTAPFAGILLESAITPIRNSSYNGIARAAVYDTGTGMDFYYQFTNDLSSINGIERFTGYNFASLGAASIVDVSQTAAAFDIFVAGTEFADGADRTTLGVIGFSFVPNGHSKINPGTTSYTEIIRTNARQYTAGNFGLLDGIGDNARAFAPTAVPEPSSLSLAAIGLLAMGFFVRRKKA